MGGPLGVVPLSAPAAWRECMETGMVVGDATAPDDYDRACVDDLAAAIAVGAGGGQAMVPLPVGRWRVRAVHTGADEGPSVGPVQLLPAGV
ncbi:Imm21 family immunity protein [Streptomyces sp. NPDC086766]|uniref:Imm21 family immunity protein n=1 Tax=Streptomyces sp. NPDC086766 TaxID=3365754 RepID=UPI00380A86ED